MLVDLHTHPVAHGERAFDQANLEQFVLQAISRGCSDLGFSDHDTYLREVKPEVIEKLKAVYPQIKLRLGLEVEFRPGGEQEIRDYLLDYPYDYLIGSVHEVDDWPFDHPDYREGYDKWQGDDLYKAYFNRVAAAACSGLFQIIGHLDVIRVFNFKPQSPLLELAYPALEAIKEKGLAIEVNTNGRYKPVSDFYPSPEVLREAYKLGIPVTLGSDAHEPSCVGRDLEEALQLIKSIGYKSIVTFDKKQCLEYPV